MEIKIKFSDALLVAKLLQLLIDITKHPDITPELEEFVGKSTVEIIDSDPDLRRWVQGDTLKRIK